MKPPAAAATLAEVKKKRKSQSLGGMPNNSQAHVAFNNMRFDTKKNIALKSAITPVVYLFFVIVTEEDKLNHTYTYICRPKLELSKLL